MVTIMNKSVEYLKLSLKDDSDFVVREIESGKKDKIYIAFSESLCDSTSIYNFIIANIYGYLNFHKKIRDLKSLISGPKLTTLKEDEEMFYYIDNGFAVVLHKNEKYAIEVKASLDRGISISQTEQNMYGPKDAFCENYQKNLGVLKRRIKNKKLKIESVDHGEYTKNKMAIVYLEDKVPPDDLNRIKDILDKYREKEVVDSHDIMKDFTKNDVFPTVLKTEKPAIAARFILKGYVVISIDNSPFALVLNAKFKDFINPFTTDKFVSVLRYICFFLTVLTPAIYISLVNFNQETIPTSLLISFTSQRMGVPFPAIVEAIIMLFICEILRECDIRFPSNYGSSASILGALILGDAAVSAGIVSPIMIITVAIAFITSLIFNEVKLVGAIRLLRISFVIISAFLGLYGLSIALVVCISIISNVKLSEGNYL